MFLMVDFQKYEKNDTFGLTLFIITSDINEKECDEKLY